MFVDLGAHLSHRKAIREDCAVKILEAERRRREAAGASAGGDSEARRRPGTLRAAAKEQRTGCEPQNTQGGELGGKPEEAGQGAQQKQSEQGLPHRRAGSGGGPSVKDAGTAAAQLPQDVTTEEGERRRKNRKLADKDWMPQEGIWAR